MTIAGAQQGHLMGLAVIIVILLHRSPTSSVASAASMTNLPLYDIGVNPVVDAYITMGGRERFEKERSLF